MMEDKNNLPELPKGWVWTTCNELIKEIESGKRPAGGVDKYTNGIPSIGGEHLNSNGGFNFLNLKFVPEEFFNNMSKGQIRKGDILIVKDGATTGKVSFVSENFPLKKAAVNEHVFILRFSENMMLSKYIFYFLFSGLGQKQIKIKGIIGGINKNFINYIETPLPPLPEQHRIVARIEELFTKLDAGIDALKKVKTQLKRYRQAVLKYAFEGKLTEEWREEHKGELEPASVLLEKIKAEKKKKLAKKYKELPPVDTENLPVLPDGWCWTRVGEVSKRIHYGYTAKSSNEETGPKLLRITDIQNNSVNWDTVPHCKISEEDKEKYLLREGDLFFARTGATVGKSFLIFGKIPEAVFASYLIRIILCEKISNQFVYKYFQSLSYWQQISVDKLGIGQPNVNAEKLSKIIFPLPPLPEQRKIVEEIERRFSIADEVGKTVEQSLKQAERLRESILKKAFEGKLIPQDPTDEPASVLLERIKKEEEKIEQEKKIKKRKSFKQKEVI